MSTEHDLEYGPTPPGAQYEHTDIDPAIGYHFGLWLFVAFALSLGIVFGTFWFLESRKVANDEVSRQFPLAVGAEKEPPAPLLQTQPFKDVYLLKQDQNGLLRSYGWVDKDGEIVHIPIDRAMDLLLQRGLPTRAGGTAAPGMVVQDSSAGTTMAPR